jgi:hypothetical protein
MENVLEQYTELEKQEIEILKQKNELLEMDVFKVIKELDQKANELSAKKEEIGSFIKTGKWNMGMSFPLGFEDLYTSLGQINVNYIGDCHGGSAYGCPGLEYDFSTSLDTDHGSSGSPIFDLDTGKVIGVTTAGTDGENMNTTWAIYSYRLAEID